MKFYNAYINQYLKLFNKALGYAKHGPAGNHSGNSRNGKTSKSVRSQNGALELDIPRDRNSTFEPTLIGKNEKQLNGFDDRIISLYSRGLSTRDIQAHFKKLVAE